MSAIVQRARILCQFGSPIDVSEQIAADAGSDDIHHIQIRIEPNDESFYGRQTSRQHGEAAGHGDVVCLHDEGHIFVQSMEALKIGGFRLEVHLFLRYQPHLVQHLIEIHQSADGGVF